MSNEEKILRQNYGINVESYINSVPQHSRYMSASMGGSKAAKSQGALNISKDLQYNNHMGSRGGFFEMKTSPYNLA